MVREAITMVAQDLKLALTDKIYNYYGDFTPCILGVQIPGGYADNNGYGARIHEGKLVVVGDDYQKDITIHAFTRHLEQAYRAVAYRRALQRQGYRISIQRQGTKYLMVGVKA
jgi:hypothetical protein